MKALLFTLCLLSGIAHAGEATYVRPWEQGTSASASGSAVYALNNVLTGTASSAIDLDGYAGAFVQVTGGTKANMTNVWFSQDNSTYDLAYTIEKQGSFFISKRARYMKLESSPNNVAGQRMSARYTLGTGVSGGGSVSSPIYSASATKMTPPSGGSTSVLATSYTAQVVNLTSTAGASVPCVICLSSNGGPAAGFRLDFGTSATAPVALTSTGVGDYVGATTTAQCWGPWAAGTHAYFSGVAASSQVVYKVLQVQ